MPCVAIVSLNFQYSDRMGWRTMAAMTLSLGNSVGELERWNLEGHNFKKRTATDKTHFLKNRHKNVTVFFFINDYYLREYLLRSWFWQMVLWAGQLALFLHMWTGFLKHVPKSYCVITHAHPHCIICIAVTVRNACA